MDTKTARRLGCAGLIALGVLPFAPTLAYAKPTVRLTLPTQVDAGVAVPYSFTASGLPPGAVLVIQRQIGNARRFLTVATLARASSGKGQLPGLSIGRHSVRIAVFQKGKRAGAKATSAPLAKQAKTLSVFAEVPFVTLFRQSPEGTYALPDRPFAYVFSAYALDALNSVQIVDKARNTCRSVHVEFAVQELTSGTQDTAVLNVVQESRDPVRAAAAVNAVGTVDAALVPGEGWSLITQTEHGKTLRVYINGTASCYSSTVQ